MAQRVLSVRSQLAKEFIEDLGVRAHMVARARMLPLLGTPTQELTRCPPLSSPFHHPTHAHTHARTHATHARAHAQGVTEDNQALLRENIEDSFKLESHVDEEHPATVNADLLKGGADQRRRGGEGVPRSRGGGQTRRAD